MSDLGALKQTIDALEAELVLSRRRSIEVLELNDIGSWEWDISSGVVIWSEKIYELLNLNSDAVDPSYELALEGVHVDDRERYEAALRHCLESEDTYHLRNRLQHADGSVLHVISLGRVHRDDDGRPIRMFGTLQDVTEATLASRRQLELENRLLQVSTLESLGRLAAGISHDFNNALMPILMGAESLVTSGASHQVKATAHMIMAAVEHAATLPSQLRGFGMPNMTNPTVTDLNEIVRSARPMLRRSGYEDVEIVYELAPTPLMCRADAGQLQQVCINLFLNGQDAICGEGTLTFETCAVRAGGRAWVCLRVVDTGSGIDPDTLTKVFEPFFTTKAPGLGTGLGLAMAQSIVSRHDGRIEVTSTLGEGTTVSIVLPEHLDVVEEGAEVPGTRVEDGGVQATILLVDDNASILQSAARALRFLGHRVFEASSASTAREIALAHGSDIDLLFTDITMPETNGIQLAAELLAAQPSLAIMFMSGRARHPALPEDAHFLSKPFRLEAMREALSNALKG